MKAQSTHLVHYVALVGSRLEYGELDASLPAGWTRENKEWCKKHISDTHPGFDSVVITGATEYKPAVNLSAVRAALVDLAANLDKRASDTAAVRHIADALRAIAAEVSK